jgi:hypothetical protein
MEWRVKANAVEKLRNPPNYQDSPGIALQEGNGLALFATPRTSDIWGKTEFFNSIDCKLPLISDPELVGLGQRRMK